MYGISTANPQTKWDYWNIENWTNPKGSNVISVDEFIKLLRQKKDRRPLAIVTPDGTWHGEEQVGTHAWQNHILSIFRNNSGCHVVFCDIHI